MLKLNSPDDDIQSAQLPKSTSEDIFNTQDLFSSQEKHDEVDIPSKSINLNVPQDSDKSDKLTVICETQPYDDVSISFYKSRFHQLFGSGIRSDCFLFLVSFCKCYLFLIVYEYVQI